MLAVISHRRTAEEVLGITAAIGEHRRRGVSPSLVLVTQPDQLALAA